MKLQLAFGLMLLLLLAACGAPKEQAELAPYKLGVIAPMSGPNAWIGDFVTNAIALAVEDVNAAGGINGRMVQSILEDADNPAKSSTAANKLISQDGVDFIYAVTTPVVASASGVADQSGVPLFGFTAVQTYAKKGTWVFSDLRDAIKECKLLSAAALKNGHTQLAFIGNDADFSQECLETLQKDFVDGGGELVANEMKISNDPDARTIITKVKSINPDAVVLVCWPPDCNTIYKQMVELQFLPQFYLPIGTALSSNPLAVKDLDKNTILKGAYSGEQGVDTEQPTPELATFLQRLEQKTGKKPTAPADAAIAYDNIHEMAEAARKCTPLTKECVRDTLAQTDYTGVAGHVVFNSKHTAERSMRLVVFKDGKWTPYEA
jgi:branched-chain amino acid transport system substrate-binding protein